MLQLDKSIVTQISIFAINYPLLAKLVVDFLVVTLWKIPQREWREAPVPAQQLPTVEPISSYIKRARRYISF
jgi:hypothetical protein